MLKANIILRGDPITQFHDIQNQWFEDSFALSNYNDNVISHRIWYIYNSIEDVSFVNIN